MASRKGRPRGVESPVIRREPLAWLWLAQHLDLHLEHKHEGETG